MQRLTRQLSTSISSATRSRGITSNGLNIPIPVRSCVPVRHSSMLVFDRKAKTIQKDRSSATNAFDFIREEIGERLTERLEDLSRHKLPTVLDLGSGSGLMAKHLQDTRIEMQTLYQLETSEALLNRDAHLDEALRVKPQRIVGDEEFIPFAPASMDLVISNLSLHWVNDLPGTFEQVCKVLRPDGLFLAAMLGGSTLQELRSAFTLAEMEREGGLSPHISPFANISDIGNLLGRAKFALTTVDTEMISVNFADPFILMRDLQGMGESNVSLQRREFTSKDTFMSAASIYQSLYANPDGSVPATFQVRSDRRWKMALTYDFKIIYLIGWSPDASQQQPKKRGTASPDANSVLELMSSPPSPLIPDIQSSASVYRAVTFNEKSQANLVKQRKANLQCETHQHGTKFLTAVILDDVKRAEELLVKAERIGQNLLTARDTDTGDSALHIACEYSALDCFDLLIKKGADATLVQLTLVNRRDRSSNEAGNTPLHLAARKSNLNVVKKLLAVGANINKLNKEERTPFYYAIWLQDDLMFETLLHGMVNVNRQVSKGYTPLHEACKQGYSRAVEMLILRGADINSLHPTSKNTPLHLACISGSESSVATLLLAGAKQEVANVKGATPFQLAHQSKYIGITDIMQRHQREDEDRKKRILNDADTESSDSDEEIAHKLPTLSRSLPSSPIMKEATTTLKTLRADKVYLESQLSRVNTQRKQAIEQGKLSTARMLTDLAHRTEDRIFMVEENLLALEDESLHLREQHLRQLMSFHQQKKPVQPTELGPRTAKLQFIKMLNLMSSSAPNLKDIEEGKPSSHIISPRKILIPDEPTVKPVNRMQRSYTSGGEKSSGLAKKEVKFAQEQ
ncbi:hypothetical protein PROFUN_11165 [Planoprotostelium fungivorum]|uniref:Methyltransferase type 11 domain-containing protein n=1 Tax=Planoprotostelium fungivorum TaxID=1890364 RepID=A0A2P6NAP6_9EUKA|nr:hypothetical protein PROFUN_11165 [Planoprotostelium fungivorum]